MSHASPPHHPHAHGVHPIELVREREAEPHLGRKRAAGLSRSEHDRRGNESAARRLGRHHATEPRAPPLRMRPLPARPHLERQAERPGESDRGRRQTAKKGARRDREARRARSYRSRARPPVLVRRAGECPRSAGERRRLRGVDTAACEQAPVPSRTERALQQRNRESCAETNFMWVDVAPAEEATTRPSLDSHFGGRNYQKPRGLLPRDNFEHPGSARGGARGQRGCVSRPVEPSKRWHAAFSPKPRTNQKNAHTRKPHLAGR